MNQFTKEGPDHITLADYINVEKDIYPVGRLDKDSEGLLILTNDKKLNEALLHPDKKHRRMYVVQLDGDITDKAIHQASKGVEIKLATTHYTTKPCSIKKLYKPPVLPERNPPVRYRKEIPTSWAVIELSEGKNRQVRKMFAKVGFPVLRLIRTQIENLKLGKLEPGKYYSIEKKELLQLLDIDYSKPAKSQLNTNPVNRKPNQQKKYSKPNRPNTKPKPGRSSDSKKK